MYYCFLFLSLISCNFLFSQTIYSKSDLLQIAKQKKLFESALKDGNKNKLYQCGRFYEKIYSKYKDTSIQTAIQCYKLITVSEGPDYMDNVSLQGAYRLGKIYETNGEDYSNLQSAMIYYFLSVDKGKYKLETLKTIACKPTEILHNSIGKYQLEDSLVLKISPFCKISGEPVLASLLRLGDFLKFNPSFRVSITVSENATNIPSPYRYWLRDNGLKKHYDYVKSYLVDKIGIYAERVEAPEIDLEKEGESRIKIKILRDISWLQN